MFDYWEILKYIIKKDIKWLKSSARQFFCKHHYVAARTLWNGIFGVEVAGVKCTKCGKTSCKEDWMTIYDEKEN